MTSLKYHIKKSIDLACQRILNALHKEPASITDLSKSLQVPSYDVTVALSALQEKGCVIKRADGVFEFLSF